MKVRKINLLIACFLLISLISGGFQSQAFASAMAKTATITVVGNETQGILLPEATVSIGEKQTALDALLQTVGAGNTEIETTKYGKSIKTIKGLTKADPFYWAFYVNGIFSQVNYDAYVVKPDDKLSFVYTDWSKNPEKTVSFKVTGKDGKELFKPLTQVSFIGVPNAFQLLQNVVGTENVGYHQYDFGKMVTSINGVEAQGSDYWSFNVNGKMASVGPESYQLHNGDEISFSYIGAPTPPNSNGSPGENKKPTAPLSVKILNKSIDSGMKYALKHGVGDWEAIALRQNGVKIPSSYLGSVTNLVSEKKGKFHKITDAERYVLGILAAGGNPENVNGYNLLAPIYNGDAAKQGLNGVAYALIAIDSATFKVPATAKWTKQKLINQLLSKQNKDGGWAWEGSLASDADSTAMVLTALAPHKSEQGTQAKINLAVKFLSSKYLAGKIDNSSTAAQAVIALSALKIDANAGQFAKDGKSLITYLLSFQNADGGFDWQGGSVSDTFSSAQGIQAVVAYKLMENGKGSIYSLPLTSGAKSVPSHNVKSANGTKKNGSGPVGHLLPNTATNDMNFIAIGCLLVFMGMIYYFLTNRKRA